MDTKQAETHSYSDQYKDPRWQKKRLEILNRDNFTCRKCKNHESQLNVHHIAYIKGRAVWDYNNMYLVTLCDTCHEEVHKELEELDAVLLSYKRRSCLSGSDTLPRTIGALIADIRG